MWFTSLLHLLLRSFSKLTETAGTSRAALIIFGVVVPIVASIIEVVRHRPADSSLLKQLTSELFRTRSVKIAACAWVFLYLWAVCATVYRDHVALLTRVQSLTLPKYAFAPNAEFGNITNTLGAFRFLKQPNRDMPERACRILITAPVQTKVIAQMLLVIGQDAGCDIVGPEYGQHDLAFDQKTTDGMLPNAVLVHTKPGDSIADGFATDLSNAFDVKVTHDLPPDSNLVWLQLGPGNVWRKN